jgi:hypothetical protein
MTTSTKVDTPWCFLDSVVLDDGAVHRDDFEDGNYMVQPPDAALERSDFHLRQRSALRDAGIDVGVTLDCEGTPRPEGPVVDIGPYEYVPPPLGTLLLMR